MNVFYIMYSIIHIQNESELWKGNELEQMNKSEPFTGQV